jgi:predicted component of type VI protein secretion system
VYCIENKFEIVIGPLNHAQARRFGPGSIKQREIYELAGLYVGFGFQFDIRYIVDTESRPDWTVQKTQDAYFKLGWNTWLPQAAAERPLQDEIVIPYSGLH